MNKKFSNTLVLFLLILLTGCSGRVASMNISSKIDMETLETPKQGMSRIIFMRPYSRSFAYQAPIFEINNNKSSILGLVAAKKKIIYDVKPGKHLFMVIGLDADFMSAYLKPNKVYYVLVQPRRNLFKSNFSLREVPSHELHSDKFTKRIIACQLVEKNDDTLKWAIDNNKSIHKKYIKYYKKWINKDKTKRPHLSNYKR